MKLPKVKLHIQILLGLLLGAVFGIVFSVDEHTLVLSYGSGDGLEEVVIENWREIEIRSGGDTMKFGPDSQAEILHLFERYRKSGADVVVTVVGTGGTEEYRDVVEITKEETPATVIKPLGDVFIRLLMMIAIPLVFASLLVGVSSLHDVGTMARIGGKTIVYYLVTTAFAISIGLAFGNILRPGETMDAAARDRMMAMYQDDAAARIDQNISIDVVDYFVNLVPKNVIESMAGAEMLQIIFFALMLGIALLFIDKEKAKRVTGFFDGVAEAMIKMVDLIMLIAPYAVFALIAATISVFGFGILKTLIWYVVAVVGGLAVQTFVVYPLLLKLLTRGVSLSQFYRQMRPAQLLAFTTSSSAATLPVTIEQCERMGAPKSVTGFVLPLGATINMDGTALYQGVAAVFIAQVFGMDLTIAQQLTIVLTATLASIGTAPVPGVGIIMLIIVLRSVGVPETGVALILGVDRILDMCRTATNVTGDATATMFVASSEGVLEKK